MDADQFLQLDMLDSLEARPFTTNELVEELGDSYAHIRAAALNMRASGLIIYETVKNGSASGYRFHITGDGLDLLAAARKLGRI